jgi:hypothetical protein
MNRRSGGCRQSYNQGDGLDFYWPRPDELVPSVQAKRGATWLS